MAVNGSSGDQTGPAAKEEPLELTPGYQSFPRVSQWADYHRSDEDETSCDSENKLNIKLERESPNSSDLELQVNMDTLESSSLLTDPMSYQSNCSSTQSVNETHQMLESAPDINEKIAMVEHPPILIAPPDDILVNNACMSTQALQMHDLSNKNTQSTRFKSQKANSAVTKLLECVRDLQTEGYDAVAVVHNYNIDFRNDWYGYCGHGELSQRFQEGKFLCSRHALRAGKVINLDKESHSVNTTGYTNQNNTGQTMFSTTGQTTVSTTGHTYQCALSTVSYANDSSNIMRNPEIVNIRPEIDALDHQGQSCSPTNTPAIPQTGLPEGHVTDDPSYHYSPAEGTSALSGNTSSQKADCQPTHHSDIQDTIIIKREKRKEVSRFSNSGGLHIPADGGVAIPGIRKMFDSAKKKTVSESTRKKMNWALKVFDSWLKYHNHQATLQGSELCVIHGDLPTMDKNDLCQHLKRFICEVKKKDGTEYPGETLYEIIVMLQLYLKVECNVEHKVLDDPFYFPVRQALEEMIEKRRADGFCTTRGQAQLITVEEEELLWHKGVLGDSQPRQLLETLIYMFGVHFALKPNRDQKNLRWSNSQIQLLTDASGLRYLQYSEDTLKKGKGTFTSNKGMRKVIPAYENKANPSRCIVELYLKYCSHRPPAELANHNSFFVRPLEKAKGQLWYSCQPLGIHTLSTVIKHICEQGGLTGHRTNFSIRVSAACHRFNAATEEVIWEGGKRYIIVKNNKRNAEDLYENCEAVAAKKQCHKEK